MCESDLGHTATREGRIADEALVEDAAQRIDVARRRRPATLDQLGREIVRRSEQLPVVREPGRVGGACEAEVRERSGAVRMEQHVRRLDVAMQDLVLVEDVEPPPELDRERGRLVEAQPPLRAQATGERAARVEGQHQVVQSGLFSELQDRDDVPGLDASREARLAQEPRTYDGLAGALRAEELDGDFGAVVGPGAEDEAGRTFAEEPLQPVAPDALARADDAAVHRAIIPRRQ
jgi:hypothetical protein